MVSERAEIRRSRSRLIRYNLISISGQFFFLLMGVAGVAIAVYEFEKAGGISADVVFSSLCVLACVWFVFWVGPRKWRYERVYRRGPELVFVLTREGLTCSFLGSDVPVPWADVRWVKWQSHGTKLILRVDPARHPSRPPNHNKSKISQRLTDGTRLDTWVLPDIFEVKSRELAELLKDWQLQYTDASPEAVQAVKDEELRYANAMTKQILIICGVGFTFLVPGAIIMYLAFENKIRWFDPDPNTWEGI